MKRVVTDIVTPGTTLSPATLVERENNYIISMTERAERIGFAILDVSTGEFSAGEDFAAMIEQALAGTRLREAILPHGSGALRSRIETLDSRATIDERAPYEFEEQSARAALRSHFGVSDLTCFDLEDKPLAIAAAGALLSFVKELRQNEFAHIAGIKLFVAGDSLFLDAETLGNLEVFEPLRGNEPDTTLIHHLDQTETAPGARELRKWLMHPSRRAEVIKRRLDAIGSLLSDHTALRALRGTLRRFADIERLLSRITALKAGPRELLALAEALERAPAIAEAAGRFDADAIREAARGLSAPISCLDVLRRGIDPASPPHLREGGVIRSGYRDDLDVLIRESVDGKAWIARLQESERERTGISSLRVGYNRVFGYYIEISRAHDDKVPPGYITKQTLVSSQRYVTEDLKIREQTIISADARRIALEREIFDTICETVSRESVAIQRIASAVATLDVLSSLAVTALERNYCRPEINETGDLVVTDGQTSRRRANLRKGFYTERYRASIEREELYRDSRGRIWAENRRISARPRSSRFSRMREATFPRPGLP